MTVKLKYGNTNTFLIRGNCGSLLVDTDYAGTLPAFYRAIKVQGINVYDIDYVMATHYHPDHMGLIEELTKQGVKLLLLDIQKPHIHFSDGIFARDRRLAYEPFSAEEAVCIAASESRDFLNSLGVSGEIISTPSHSEDSVSLLLDGGECFVGDLEPFEYLEGYTDNEQLKNDWALVMSYKPKAIYYAHANEKLL